MQSYENYSKLSLKALKTKTILCYFFTTRIHLINLILSAPCHPFNPFNPLFIPAHPNNIFFHNGFI